MEEAPENGKESSHSAHANERMNERIIDFDHLNLIFFFSVSLHDRKYLLAKNMQPNMEMILAIKLGIWRQASI